MIFCLCGVSISGCGNLPPNNSKESEGTFLESVSSYLIKVVNRAQENAARAGKGAASQSYSSVVCDQTPKQGMAPPAPGMCNDPLSGGEVSLQYLQERAQYADRASIKQDNETGNIPRGFLNNNKNISWTEAELARFAKEPFRKKKVYPIGESPWDKIKNKNPLKEYSRAGYWKGLDEQYRKGYLAYNAAASTDHGIDKYYWEQEINPPNSIFCGTPSRIKTLKDLKAEELSRKGSICEGVPLRIRKSDEQVNKEWEEYVTSDEYMAKRMSGWDRQDEMAGALLFIGLAVFLKAGVAPELIAPRFIRTIPKGLSGKMEGLTVLDTQLKNTITTVAPKGTLKNIAGSTFKRLRLLEEAGVKNTTKTIVVH